MEPVSIILTALATGAAAAAKDTASQVVKDAYAALKARVLRKLQASDQNAATVVDAFEKDAPTWEKPLQKSLTAAGAAADAELVGQAQQVLQVVRPEQHAQGRFNVQVTGDVQGQIIGDGAVQHNTYGRD